MSLPAEAAALPAPLEYPGGPLILGAAPTAPCFQQDKCYYPYCDCHRGQIVDPLPQ